MVNGMTRLLRAIAIITAVAILAAALWLRLGPLPEGLIDPSRLSSVTVVDRRGEVLFDGLSGLGTRGTWMTADEVPDRLAKAVVAAEDRRFFAHPGIDPLAIARATLANARALSIVEGGSTISQQTAKLLLASMDEPDRSRFGRKLREAIVALRLEHRYSKREILALYLNVAPFGNQYAGARRASLGYFGVEPSRLTDAQAALLAALPQRPSALDPRRHFDRARRRQQRVLRAMDLDDRALKLALEERVRILPPQRDLLAPHLTARLQNEWRGKSARVTTTIDAALQREVRGILEAHRERLRTHQAHNVAVAVLHNATGEWLAWEGSGDWFDEVHGGAIDGVRVPRQPGSALKPFAYAAAFDQGWEPSSILPDVEASFPTAEEGITYVPRNYDGTFRGPVRAREALALSLNVPAVWLASRVGVPAFLGTLRRAGISTLDRSASWYGLGAVLGGGEVTLEELVGAYAALARGGVWIESRVIPGGMTEPTRILSEDSAFFVSSILDDEDARAAVFGRDGSLELPFPVAAKTGTSQAFRDNWAIGYTPEITVGVWVGNFDRKELRGSSGVTGAAPIFHDVMLAAQARWGRSDSTFDPPLGLRRAPVCLLSGLEPTAACPRAGSEWTRGISRGRCSWHRTVRASNASGAEITTAAVDWPAEYRAWAAAHDRVSPLRQLASAEAPRTGKKSLSIVHPPDGSTYLIDPTLRSAYQTVTLRAAADAGSGSLEWRVNGKRVARASSLDPVQIPMKPGTMRIEVRDGRGGRDEVTVRVR